jgi:hypothetical protein
VSKDVVLLKAKVVGRHAAVQDVIHASEIDNGVQLLEDRHIVRPVLMESGLDPRPQGSDAW